ncbi:MAG: CYTH domain-containing protein [Chthoniobacterales bacterium]
MSSAARDQHREIERKFLVLTLPANLAQLAHAEIEQGYLAIAADGVQVRLRKAGETHSLTSKRGRGNAREEREIELSPEQFSVLWPATAGRRLTKTRYDVPLGDRVVEIDVYSGRHEGLIVAEVEFDDEESAAAFQPPEWLGDDVTHESRYSNQLLAS